MGVYLNSGNDMFMQARRSKIYVDKSQQTANAKVIFTLAFTALIFFL